MSKTSRSGSEHSEAWETAEDLGPFGVLRLVSATQPRPAHERFGGGVSLRLPRDGALFSLEQNPVRNA